jgi:hypothetical protein
MMTQTTITPDDLVVLRWLDEQADRLRDTFGLHLRGEPVGWFENRIGDREYLVTADGYGQFELIEYTGHNPNDRVVHHAATYHDEEAGWRAALRLGEHGVAWGDRDTPAPGEGEFPEDGSSGSEQHN